MQLLHIDSSILGGHSVSRTLSAEIVEAERRRFAGSGLKVIYRDLAAAPFQHFTGAHFAARNGQGPIPSEIESDVAQSQTALDDFLSSDIVVIGAPMYNFGIPTQLKAWIDRLAVAGKTFTYSKDGPKGLAGGKRVIIASSRGGAYGSQTPMAFRDHQETYLKAVMEFMGITDITFIRAEGFGGDADRKTQSIQTARTAIAGLA